MIALWSRCGLLRPANDPRRDIARKLNVRPDLFLVGEEEGRLVAAGMAGYEGHRGWLNYLAVEPDRGATAAAARSWRRRSASSGRRLSEGELPPVRTGNAPALEFYRKIGYAVDDVVSMGKRLTVDRPPA